MQGPDGSRHYCRANYTKVVPYEIFIGDDAFCDERGKINHDLPKMHWEAHFSELGKAQKLLWLIATLMNCWANSRHKQPAKNLNIEVWRNWFIWAFKELLYLPLITKTKRS